jgi:hypothetical protein
MADVDASLEQEAFDISEGQRESHIRHDHEPDNLRRTVELAEWVGGLGHSRADLTSKSLSPRLR